MGFRPPLLQKRPLAPARTRALAVALYGVLCLALAALCAVPAGADMPNRALTPGEVVQRDTGAVCLPGNARRHRAVPYRIRDRVYLEYGIARGHRQGRYKIDHLVPLELGGSNGMRNLWPQRTSDAARKDRVEDQLHAAVCDGSMPLERAQRAIANDWRSAVPSH